MGSLSRRALASAKSIATFCSACLRFNFHPPLCGRTYSVGDPTHSNPARTQANRPAIPRDSLAVCNLVHVAVRIFCGGFVAKLLNNLIKSLSKPMLPHLL